MTDHILVSPAACQTCAVFSSIWILFRVFRISCIQLGSYRSTQAAWPPALFSSGCFDVQDLTESVDMLESPGFVVTVLSASDCDLVNSVTELSCLTSSFQHGKVPFLICWVCLSCTSLVVFLVMIAAELFSDLLNLTSKALLS
jgi:hypothetical protein